ncbi:MAG: SWIM zinc finger family protein [Caldilineaceae bacterium]
MPKIGGPSAGSRRWSGSPIAGRLRKRTILCAQWTGAVYRGEAGRYRGPRARIAYDAVQNLKIHLKALTPAEWNKVLAALAERAIFTAQLLAGEMPPDIEEAFAAAGVSLFPAQGSDLETACSCPDFANPCKHVAATHYILGERFDADPFLLFRLRGRSQDEIFASLRAMRSAEEINAVAGKAQPMSSTKRRPLRRRHRRFLVDGSVAGAFTAT